MVNNCFGDYYTQNGLDDKEREMVTFCYLAAQGGCESQLLAPFIVYPRSLNGIDVINQVK